MTVIARLLAVLALAAALSTGCTSGAHTTAVERTTPVQRKARAPTVPAGTPAPTVPATGPVCSAAEGSLVPSATPFINAGRLIQPFGYVNQGPPCVTSGFPVVQLYDAQHQLLNIAEVDGNVVIGAAAPARLLLPQGEELGGFNIETPTSGSSCVTAVYVSASFGGGTTPVTAIDNYQACGTLYLTPIFE